MADKPLYEFDADTRHTIVKMHLHMRYQGEVTGPIEGAYGEVYSIRMPDGTFPRQLAAKCPKIKRFGSLESAREGIENVLHELEKCHKVFSVPWVNRFFEVQFIHGWPFIWSRYRDGTLEDLIANPLSWTQQDRLVSLIQTTRALSLAKSKGIISHQDLKPGNIFFDDLTRKGIPKDSPGMHFHIFVADFGLANAFRDLGVNNGSRPYIAPEQFSTEDAHVHTSEKFDVYALGILMHECLLDGLHPMGVVTRDVWPWRVGLPRKWDRASTWREWAQQEEKQLPEAARALNQNAQRLLLRCLSVDPSLRPSLDELEISLWHILREIDANTAEGFRMQMDYVEGLSSDDDEWPHMDERVRALREFYSKI